MANWRKSFLLVTDIDGTLITYDGLLPERNIRAIDDYMEKGGKFTIATGRSIQSARRYAEKIKPNAPVILLNGAMVYDYKNENVLYKAVLPCSGESIIKKVMHNFSDVGVGVHTTDRLFIVNSTPLTDDYILHEHTNAFKASVSGLPEEIMKIIFMAPEKRCDELQEYIISLSLGGVQCIRSSSIYFEILPDGLSKGTALEKLANALDIKMENTVAVGDYYNDIDLIRKASVGLAVENAVDQLKEVADFIVSDCAKGAVADAVEYMERVFGQSDN